MEDTAYRIIIMAQADQALHHIVLHVKQSFSNETAKSVYQEIKDRILLLADNPYMGMIPRHTVLRNKNYRMLIINKNIILYYLDSMSQKPLLRSWFLLPFHPPAAFHYRIYS